MEFSFDTYSLVFVVIVLAVLIFVFVRSSAKDATADMDVLREWTTPDGCRHRTLQCNECLAVVSAELPQGRKVWYITDDDLCECFGN